MGLKKSAMTFALAAAMTVALLSGCANKKAERQSAAADNASLSSIEVKLGIEMVEGGNLDGGMAHFQKAMEYDAKNPRAWCGMGSVYRMRDKYDEAIENYNKAIALKPDYQVCLDNLGLVYALKGDSAKAMEYFNKAIALDPNYADVYFNIGLMHNKKGDNLKAIEQFEKYLSLSSDEKKKAEVQKELAELKALVGQDAPAGQ